MRIAVVGPTFPYKGGIAQHTTLLAHRLAERGHQAELWSWSHQYPERLYPGQQRVAEPEVPTFPGTSYPLSWRRPDSWLRAGRRVRSGRFDAVVPIWLTTIQAPAYATLLAAAGAGVRKVAICHNVLPHERRFFDLAAARSVLGRCDGLLVHGAAEADKARGLVNVPVRVETLPPILGSVLTSAGESTTASRPVARHLLFFGLVRPYKGLDVLLRALALGPDDVRLTVAGEFWGGTAETEALVAELGIADRVTLRPGYVDSADVAPLFASSDALVLPYRSASSTANALLAFEHGVPIVATDVGAMREQVTDGVSGLICPPEDPRALSDALRQLYEPGVLDRLRAGVPDIDVSKEWDAYVDALEALIAGGAPAR